MFQNPFFWRAKPVGKRSLGLPTCVWFGSGAFLSELLFCAQPVKQFIAWRAAPRIEDFLSALPDLLDRRLSALGRFCWIVLSCRVVLSCPSFHCALCFRARFSQAKSVGKRTVASWPAATAWSGARPAVCVLARGYYACGRCALPGNRVGDASVVVSGWVD